MHDGSNGGDGLSLMEIIALIFMLAILVGAFTKKPKCTTEHLTKQQKEQCHAAANPK